MSGRSMYKTKLCISFKRGRCSRPNCSFAHGNAELRRPMDSSNSDRRNNHDIDLRNKLGRQLSLERRVSPRRDTRGRVGFSGYEASMSLGKRRDTEHGEDRRSKDPDDYAGNSRSTKGNEGQATDGEDGSNSGLDDQLKEAQIDINLLANTKHQIGACIEEKVQEADSLISRIQELEAQLNREQDESKRITLSIKKFVKEYSRFSRAQEDLKRSEARLQKLGSQLGADLARAGGDDDDLNINILSDVENTRFHLKSPQTTQNELHHRSSTSKKRLLMDQDIINEHKADDGVLGGSGRSRLESVKLRNSSHGNSSHGNSSHGNSGHFVSHMEKEAVKTNDRHVNDEPSVKEYKRKRRKISDTSPSMEKLKGSGSIIVAPSTSMAAHAVDEVTEVEEKIEVVHMTTTPEAQRGATLDSKDLPLSLPPPPPLPVFNSSYSRYEGKDENVDAVAETTEMG